MPALVVVGHLVAFTVVAVRFGVELPVAIGAEKVPP